MLCNEWKSGRVRTPSRVEWSGVAVPVRLVQPLMACVEVGNSVFVGVLLLLLLSFFLSNWLPCVLRLVTLVKRTHQFPTASLFRKFKVFLSMNICWTFMSVKEKRSYHWNTWMPCKHLPVGPNVREWTDLTSESERSWRQRVDGPDVRECSILSPGNKQDAVIAHSRWATLI